MPSLFTSAVTSVFKYISPSKSGSVCLKLVMPLAMPVVCIGTDLNHTQFILVEESLVALR